MVFSFIACASSNKEIAVNSTSDIKRNQVGVIDPKQFFQIEGVELAVHDSDPQSNKTVMLCLHAIGHGGRDFAELEKAFSNRYRIITLDWPGQGFSGQDNIPASSIRYSILLNGLVDKLKINNFIIIGNSIGAAAALKYAIDHQDKIKAMILSNPGGLDSGGMLASVFLWWMESRFEVGAEKKDRYQNWFKNYYDEVLITDQSKSEKDRIVASAYEIAPRLVEAWHSFRLPENDFKAEIPKIKIPILFAWASEDRYVQWARNKEAVEKFSNAKVIQFKAGHSPFLETPEEYISAIKDFLNSLSNYPPMNP